MTSFDRRTLLRLLASFPAALAWPAGLRAADETRAWVNDIHSQLNRTEVRRIVRPDSTDALRTAIQAAMREDVGISLAGGRHAMGGQQFGRDTDLLDMNGMGRVLGFDRYRGLIEVEAGIQWPALVDYLLAAQEDSDRPWGIVQKQTGADRLSIGGALAANVHGRGLRMKPFIQDVESFVLVDGAGRLKTCSRTESPELFRLAIGGYALFGAIASVTLRLAPRRKLRREVEIAEVRDLMPAFQDRIDQGYSYGDFQFSTDETSQGFLRQGVLSCYRPVDPATPIPEAQARLSRQDWSKLLTLAHTDRRRAFNFYSRYYLSTTGQIYWSDTHQMSVYVDDYHAALDRQLNAAVPATEMITEIYVPRRRLVGFMERVRQDFLANEVVFIYGTIRLIERDEESFLAWAREPYACVIFNLHIPHTAAGLAKAATDFQRLIDRALERGGSYYLTYHRWARRDQVMRCYPQFVDFLRLKKQYDPDERFQSEWYRHYKTMFADAL